LDEDSPFIMLQLATFESKQIQAMLNFPELNVCALHLWTTTHWWTKHGSYC